LSPQSIKKEQTRTMSHISKPWNWLKYGEEESMNKTC